MFAIAALCHIFMEYAANLSQSDIKVPAKTEMTKFGTGLQKMALRKQNSGRREGCR
jgi:hypothetical protein